MKEQPHYTNLLTKKFFEKHYLEERRSYPEIREMLSKQGFNIHVGTLYNYAKQHGIGRSRSEAKRNQEENPLDYSISFLTEEMIESIDGFLLGDGYIEPNDERSSTLTGRAKWSVEHQEFCLFFASHLFSYLPLTLQVESPKSPSGKLWHGYTRHHPDFYAQLLRWYPMDEVQQKRIKVPPQDVRITPKSVMLWYLGDGSVVQEDNAIALRLSTDGFSQHGVEFLSGKLQEKGIACHRNNDNRIYIEAKGVPAFFAFIGKESPVKCYDYKFKLPEWRLDSKRMKDVAVELDVDYQRLAYLVKIGRITVYRASENGKPRFLPEHVKLIKTMVDSGEFFKDNRK